MKLEFGSLTDQQPVGRHSVRAWLAEILPQAFPDWRCEVVALELERSFWEKATILHTEYHRPSHKRTPDRFSRHYADTAALTRHLAVVEAIKDHVLRDSWASYDLAKPGTFRLRPPPERLPALRRDYQVMKDMYLSEPPRFEEVMKTLADLEQRINRVAGG